MKDWKFISGAIKTLKWDYKDDSNKDKFVDSLIKKFVEIEDKNGQLSAENSDLKTINDNLNDLIRMSNNLDDSLLKAVQQ